MAITYDDWISQTKKRFHKRSTELKRVDKAFKKFEDMGGKGSSLQDLARVFKLWIGTKGGDHLSSIRNRKEDASGVGPVEQLQSLIRSHQFSNVAVVRTLQAEVPDRLVMDASLSSRVADKTKVTETFNRSKMAVRTVHQAMLKATSAGAERTLYERWFGDFSAARHKTVMKNYTNLLNLFNSGVIIIHDARTLAGVWGDCFGFAMPGSKLNYVEFTVGRAFFQKTDYSVVPGATPQQRNLAVRQALAEAYKDTSDWTVGTMIHELGHAINNLPDIDFQPPNTFQESPGGMTPAGWEQCSTPDLDLDLAVDSPALAVRNTDNYGQCAREALQAKGR